MNLPADFLKDIETELGRTEADKLASVLVGNDMVTSIRLNARKSDSCGLSVTERRLKPVPWCPEGFYLKERPAFTFDPLLHAGVYYVQEASSMFLQQAIRQYVKEPVRMLDLCAAPGGKSTLALQNLPEGSFLVSNEIDRQRSRILAENLIKWGTPNVLVTNNAPRDFSYFPHYFDVVLTDVPCSGEGMFRKDEQAVAEWSERNVAMCTERQRSILQDCWNCLKPGGLLIYSTCTFNLHEDEENVHWIVEHLEAESLPVDVDEQWNIVGNLAGLPESVYHFFPHRTEGEGFFLAVLRKKESLSNESPLSSVVHSKETERKSKGKLTKYSERKKHKKNATPSFKVSGEIKDWLKDPNCFTFHEKDDMLIAIPASLDNDFRFLMEALHPLQSGITVAFKKGKAWTPAHSLAMSLWLNKSAFSAYDVTLEQAWSYLRGESFALPKDIPVGFVLITYREYPLGFVKNIGNRSNNLYPQNWKIRSSHLPDPKAFLSVVQ